MDNCWFTGTRDCQKTAFNVDVRYFWGNKLISANATEISKNCICISTQYCIPLNSRIELLIPFRKSILTILARVSSYRHTDSLYDTMYVEVLGPTEKYLEFVNSFENRAHRRKNVHLDAELDCGGIDHRAVIQNISSNGLCVVFTYRDSQSDRISEKKIHVTLYTASGQAMSLHCMERWSRPVSNHAFTISMGLEILEPPPQYDEFLKTL